MTNEEIESCIQTLRFLENTFLDDHGIFLNDKHPDNIEKIITFLHESPCEDCIRELIREFDNKHPALFADYMREFNNHPISEIIDYMWDMHDLIEDIRYRLPNEGGEKE